MTNEQKDKAVCLVSGGMDSLVTLAIALLDYDVAVMHACYGQKTQERELRAFEDIADHYGIERRLIFSLEYLKKIGGSSLTSDEIDVYVGGLDTNTIPNTYVPFRNAHLLCTAVSWAEVTGAVKVFIGAVEEDSSGYPDCREDFFNAFNLVIEKGTLPDTRIEIATPNLHLSKAQIVKRGIELKVPFELTWSCYKNSDIACGLCDACLLRLRAFREAGYDDPIPYEVRK